MYHTCKLTDLLPLSDSGEGAHPDGIGGGGPWKHNRATFILTWGNSLDGYVEAPEDLAACRQAPMESVDD